MPEFRAAAPRFVPLSNIFSVFFSSRPQAEFSELEIEETCNRCADCQWTKKRAGGKPVGLAEHR